LVGLSQGGAVAIAYGPRWSTEIQACGARSSTLQKRAPLDIVMPTTASVPSLLGAVKGGLETLMLAALPQ
jgi:hypothetical protein